MSKMHILRDHETTLLLCGINRYNRPVSWCSKQFVSSSERKENWCKTCKMLYNANHSKQGKILK